MWGSANGAFESFKKEIIESSDTWIAEVVGTIFEGDWLDNEEETNRAFIILFVHHIKICI